MFTLTCDCIFMNSIFCFVSTLLKSKNLQFLDNALKSASKLSACVASTLILRFSTPASGSLVSSVGLCKPFCGFSSWYLATRPCSNLVA